MQPLARPSWCRVTPLPVTACTVLRRSGPAASGTDTGRNLYGAARLARTLLCSPSAPRLSTPACAGPTFPRKRFRLPRRAAEHGAGNPLLPIVSGAQTSWDLHSCSASCARYALWSEQSGLCVTLYLQHALESSMSAWRAASTRCQTSWARRTAHPFLGPVSKWVSGF